MGFFSCIPNDEAALANQVKKKAALEWAAFHQQFGMSEGFPSSNVHDMI